MLDWLFNKKEKKYSEDMNLEEFTPNKKFKWIKGERFGTVCTLKEVKNGFLIFNDNTRCHGNLLNDMIIPTTEEDPDLSDIEQLKQGLGVNTASHIVPQVVQMQNVLPANVPVFIKTQTSQESTSPVSIILDKQKIKPSTITLSFDVRIPKEELIEVLNSSFDGAEEEILKWVSTQITSDKILESLKKMVKPAKVKKVKSQTEVSG